MSLDCPTPAELQAFARAALADERAAGILEHLERCPACEATLVSLEAEDTLLVGLRLPHTADSCLTETAFQAVMPRIEALAQGGSSPIKGSPSAHAEEPRQIGEYLLLDRLGAGAMGVVYRAFHQRLKRPVALKVVSAARSASAQAVGRFEREMEAIGQLDDPHVVRALDAGTAEGRQYLAMELVEGENLAALVARSGPLGVADACECIRQAALGLEHAHQRGLVHRDIKPSNLILDRQGTLKVLDLGLARLAAGSSDELSHEGQTVGTLDYMAPEQAAAAGSADIRSDIYALGCTLFKLLTGRAPFEAPQFCTPAQKMLAHASREVPLDALPARSRRELGAILARMTAKEPGKRFASPREVAAALAPLAEGADLRGLLARGGGPSPAGAPPTRPPVRSVAAIVGLSVFALVVVAAIVIRITLPDGQKLTLQVPDNTKIEISDSKPPVQPEKPKVEPPAVGQAAGGPSGVVPKSWKPGLALELYPRHRDQDGRDGAFVPLERLGKPLGERSTILRLDPWKHPEDLNGVVSGALKIEQPGIYEFDSVSHYARSVLYVNGQEICSYRNLERVGKVNLAPGLIRVVSASYVNGRGEVYVRWKPPGEKELRPIPQELLYHDPAAYPAVEPEPVPGPTDPPPPPADLVGLKPGLWGETYPRQAAQKPGVGGLVPPEKLTPSAGRGDVKNPRPSEGFVVHNLCPWKYPPETNAVARGWLRIDVAGEYAFQGGSSDDRNALYLDGQEVCRYNDGEFTVSRIKLPRGWTPIKLIGYIDAKEQLELRWQPPGQRVFTPIPQQLLFHVPPELGKP